MSGEAWLYLLAVLINAVNLFLQVFFTLMYSDLEWYVASRYRSLFGWAHFRSAFANPCLFRFRSVRVYCMFSQSRSELDGILSVNMTLIWQ